MEKLIVIDSCMRPESRTRRILKAAMEVLSQRYEVETLDVNALGFAPLTPASLADRDSGKVDERALPIARRIAAADRLVIAAPFWDMSFPAVLKAFFESVSLFGVTFTDDGTTCTGLCRCRKVMYITSRGMDIRTGSPLDQGSSYIQALSYLWGLGEVVTVAAWGLGRMSPESSDKKVGEIAGLAKALALTF